ncbi:Hpt domain-containing protein [Thaumasiovibrio sp. DFM-14]|uniref:Hpt domain-containing protein n=1 Tax=Thaumasiovibrio sp. DFM-14 TaxID=3384792 RepID=UPI0039A1BB90
MIDIDELSELTGGDDDILQQVIMMYLEEHGNDQNLIAQYVAEGNHQALHHTIHTLKGALRTMCEKDVVKSLDDIESMARDGRLPNADLLTPVNAELANIHQQLNSLSTSN